MNKHYNLTNEEAFLLAFDTRKKQIQRKSMLKANN